MYLINEKQNTINHTRNHPVAYDSKKKVSYRYRIEKKLARGQWTCFSHVLRNLFSY